MPVPRRILAVASSVVCALALAASAKAATIKTSACIRTVDSVAMVPIAGTGFTPNSSITLRSSPEGIFTSVVTDAAGAFSTTTGNPSFRPVTRQLQTFELTATDDINPAIVAQTTYKQVRVGYLTSPLKGPTALMATHTVRGLLPGRIVFLHFRFNAATRADVRVGKAGSPCGVASTRVPLLPTESSPGKWTVYADHAPKFSLETKPQLKSTFTIKRSVKDAD